jgi:hypothetical protein
MPARHCRVVCGHGHGDASTAVRDERDDPAGTPSIDVAKSMATVSCCRAIVSRWAGLDGWRTNTARQQSTFTRGKRCDEIDVMRLLWSGSMVEYHGQHFDFPDHS